MSVYERSTKAFLIFRRIFKRSQLKTTISLSLSPFLSAPLPLPRLTGATAPTYVTWRHDVITRVIITRD